MSFFLLLNKLVQTLEYSIKRHIKGDFFLKKQKTFFTKR